jgi:hypothetical protein
MTESILQLLDSTIAAARSLPLGVHALPIVGLLAGVVLWIWGKRVLKPITVVLGVLIGSTLGLLLAPSLSVPDLAGMPGPYVGLVSGGFLGLLISLILFRFSMGFAAAIALGLAGFLAGMIALSQSGQLQPLKPEAAERVTKLSAQAAEITSRLGESIKSIPGLRDGGIKPATDAADLASTVRAFVDDLSADIVERWDAMTPRARLILFGGTLLGWMLGLAIGLAAPKSTSAAVTACLGSALWMFCAVTLAQVHNLAVPPALADRPMMWAGAWLIASIAGIVIQAALTKRRGKPAQVAAA